MTRLLTLLFTFLILSLSGQTVPKSGGSKEIKQDAKGSPSSTQNMVHTIKSDTCVGKKFSIVFYLIQDSLYSLPNAPGALASYSLQTIMNTLNATFARICVSFEHCKTIVIPAYPYNRWKPFTAGAQVISTWFQENTINVYLPDEILPNLPDIPEHSYTFPPATGTHVTRNAIVCEKAAASFTNNVGFHGSALMHAFGHFFGLPHTYAEINPTLPPQFPPSAPVTTMEYADRTDMNNCKDHGDGFCDTDADAFPYSSSAPQSGGNCGSTGLKDGKGNWYTLPFDNFMSHYACRCRFSSEQYQFMARYIIKHRWYLY